VRVVVNGGVAVDVQRDTPEIPNPPVYYGINPVGGSLVGLSFSGRILSAHREPVGE